MQLIFQIRVIKSLECQYKNKRNYDVLMVTTLSVTLSVYANYSSNVPNKTSERTTQ